MIENNQADISRINLALDDKENHDYNEEEVLTGEISESFFSVTNQEGYNSPITTLSQGNILYSIVYLL